jgi:dGTP triphosphohydrolase
VGNGYDQQIATMVGDAVATSLERPEVTLSEPLQEACSALRRCLVERVSRRPAARAERERAVHCLCSIAVFYLENGERLPDEHSGRDALEARVVDFVAGMTDVQARAEFARLFMPSGSPAS